MPAKIDVINHEGFKFAASLVFKDKIDPDIAFRSAQQRGFEIPISLNTFRRYLREISTPTRRNQTKIQRQKKKESQSIRPRFIEFIPNSKKQLKQDQETVFEIMRQLMNGLSLIAKTEESFDGAVTMKSIAIQTLVNVNSLSDSMKQEVANV